MSEWKSTGMMVGSKGVGTFGSILMGLALVASTTLLIAGPAAAKSHKKVKSSCSAYRAGKNGVIRTFCSGPATATVITAGGSTLIKGGTCGKSGSYFTVNAGRHKTIATLRADGWPRISGIECEFTDGDLRFGSMTGARKGVDLKRDPRCALHGPTFHPEEGKEGDWPGEAKIAGRAIPAGPVTAEASGEQPDGEMFIMDISEVVITGLNAEASRLVVESWTPERGLRRVERD